MSREPNASSLKRVAGLLPALLLASLAHATSGAEAQVLEGTWCNHDDVAGETIVRYSIAGSEVTAFTVLSEIDPRRIGAQASLQLTREAPNVFSRQDADRNSDEVLSVSPDQLTVFSVAIQNRGTQFESQQVVTSRSYRRCDGRNALARAMEFMTSAKAEEATRKAFQREQWEREDAELEERRNAGREAYYGGLIYQMRQARGLRVLQSS